MCVGVPELANIADFHCVLHLLQQVQVVPIYHAVSLPSELQLEGDGLQELAAMGTKLPARWLLSSQRWLLSSQRWVLSSQRDGY